MKIKVLVVGCGDRATVYCHEGVDNLKQMQVVAAVDPNPERLRYMRENFGVAQNMCFDNIEDVLALGKIADAAQWTVCVLLRLYRFLNKATICCLKNLLSTTRRTCCI